MMIDAATSRKIWIRLLPFLFVLYVINETLTHPRVWHLAIIGTTHAIGVYTLNFWLPQTVKSLFGGASNTAIGFVVAVPYAVALIAMIVTSRHSDRVQERRYHLAIALAAAGLAFFVLHTTGSPVLSVALPSIVAAGVYSFFGPYFASTSAFLTGYAAATGIALITSVANLGGFIGPYAVGFITRRTGNVQNGMLVAGISLLVSSLLASRLPRRLTA
jgi:ACS family tartrate transporter-like MFS transporter